MAPTACLSGKGTVILYAELDPREDDAHRFIRWRLSQLWNSISPISNNVTIPPTFFIQG